MDLAEIPSHYLYPSEIFADKNPHCVLTILGSCVAVCLYDKNLKIGGINHFMLPFWNGRGLASPKYGNIAIEKLIERMVALGSSKPNISAKIFGGGNVLETSTDTFNIGSRNIQVALEVLAEHKIPILAKSTGGKQGRRIIFNTFTNEIQQKYI